MDSGGVEVRSRDGKGSRLMWGRETVWLYEEGITRRVTNLELCLRDRVIRARGELPLPHYQITTCVLKESCGKRLSERN